MPPERCPRLGFLPDELRLTTIAARDSKPMRSRSHDPGGATGDLPRQTSCGPVHIRISRHGDIPKERKCARLPAKTAFVTAGASGIGFAIVRAFAAVGMHVMLADIERTHRVAVKTPV